MVDGDEQNDSWASDEEDACDDPAQSRQSNLSDKIGDVTVKADVDADGGTAVYIVRPWHERFEGCELRLI